LKNYALCFAAPVPSVDWTDVLMVDQNLPADEVRDGEMPEQAAYRILQGMGITASLPDTRIMVHVCHCPVRGGLRAITGRAAWLPLEQVIKSPVVLHAAKLAIALCRSGMTKWAFRNNGAIVGLNLEGWQ
jgi:hypothetical protein